MLLALGYIFNRPLLAFAIGVIPYALWIALALSVHRKPVPRHVSALLAGIPLVDAMVLVPLSQVAHSMVHLPEFALWSWALAFILGRILQRVAPAT